MYIRFVCDRPHPTVAARAGIFHAYWQLLDEYDDADFRAPHRGWRGGAARTARRRWLALREAGRALGNLPSPQLRGRGGIKGANKGLFWFRANAGWDKSAPGTIILDARSLAMQLSRWGVAIREISRRDPGEIIWQDRFQVLAIPRQ